jgi:hypothetical protein
MAVKIDNTCKICGEEALYLYHITDTMGCVGCFHAFLGNSAYEKMGVKIPAAQKKRLKYFK